MCEVGICDTLAFAYLRGHSPCMLSVTFPSLSFGFSRVSFQAFVGMSRTLDECDAILDLMCDCYRMSVEKTRWYGDNIGRRYRECGEDVCGFHKWMDPPLCLRSREAIRELQDRHTAETDSARRRRDEVISWYHLRLREEKKKFKEAVAGLSILCDVVKNLVLETADEETPAPVVTPEDMEELD